MVWMRFASSSRNDQLEAPLIGSPSYERRFHSPDDGFRSTAEHGLPLPREIVSEQSHGVDTILSGEKPERSQSPEGAWAEQVSTMIAESLLTQQPPRRSPRQHAADEQPGARFHQGRS
jgi:hypothetical protein